MEDFFSLQELYEDRLETKRIRTRFLNHVDIQLWIPFFEEDSSIEFLMKRDQQSNEQLSANWINRQLNRYQDGSFGLQAIIDIQSKKIVGHCGLLLQKVNSKIEVEIGYHILPEFRNQQYASEAVGLFVNYAFNAGICKTLICMIHENNIISEKVALKNKFVKDFQIIEGNQKINIFRLNKSI